MAHWPIVESAPILQQLNRRVVYTHINNTNPILLSTPERQAIEKLGFEIAYDGMRIVS